MQDHVITINLGAIAKYFYIICIIIIDHLIVFGKLNGFVKPIFYCYNVMEINELSILHLRYIFWSTGNLGLVDIRARLLENKAFVL